MGGWSAAVGYNRTTVHVHVRSVCTQECAMRPKIVKTKQKSRTCKNKGKDIFFGV
jgi:hypothetical protein